MDHNIVHVFYKYYSLRGCQEAQWWKNLTANTGDETSFPTLIGKGSLGEGNGWHHPILLPAESHGWVAVKAESHMLQRAITAYLAINNKALSCSGCMLGRRRAHRPSWRGAPLLLQGQLQGELLATGTCSPWQKILGQGTDSTCVSEGPEVFHRNVAAPSFPQV